MPSPTSFFGDKPMRPVDRLHVHGFPYRTSFCAEACQGIQDFLRAAFSFFRFIGVVQISPHLMDHGFRLDDHAAEPEVRDGFFGVVWVHFYGETCEAVPIAFIDFSFSFDVLVEVGKLAADDAGDDVAHAVVVAYLLVLVPGGRFATLGGPFADFVGVSARVREKHAAGTAGDDFVSVEGDSVRVADAAGFTPNAVQEIFGAQAFGGVLDDQGVMLLRNVADFLHFSGSAVEMRDDDQVGLGIQAKGFFQRFGIHVPGFSFRVDEDGFSVLVSDRVDRSVEGNVGAEDFMSGEGAFVRGCLAVELFPGEFCSQVKGGGSGGQRHGVSASHILGDGGFDGDDVASGRRDPVGVEGFVDIALLFTVHGGAGEPDALRERLQAGESTVVFQVHLFSSFQTELSLFP